MTAPALRLVQGGRSMRSREWGTASPGGLLADALASAFKRIEAFAALDARRCLCGCELAEKPCACCGAPVGDCPECPRTEWRDGRRIVVPTRCELCSAAGCRHSDSSSRVVRCRPDLGEFVVHDGGGDAA